MVKRPTSPSWIRLRFPKAAYGGSSPSVGIIMEYKTKVQGTYGEAQVYTDVLDESSHKQIQQMMDCPLFEGMDVRIMPDVHAGKGSVVGFTSSLGARVCPNIVGVDIGCGVTLDRIKAKGNYHSFEALDKVIREVIPSGFSVHNAPHPVLSNPMTEAGQLFGEIEDDLARISRTIGISHERVVSSIGTLGGGNHYVEVDRDEDGVNFLSLHSGSRGFGAKLAEYHQGIAYRLHDEGKFSSDTPKGLAWLEGEEAAQYGRDVQVAQKYAQLNRMVMAWSISHAMNWSLKDHIESVHNYIDYENGFIRKGAISSKEGESMVVPISMADGVIIGTGKGNSLWNFSAPHGAGRLFARGEAKRRLSMEEFKTRMEGVWSSCVSTATIDESPMAYKGAAYILERIQDTLDVVKVAKPVYNFKAVE
jgi:tRNA-splicing ligase RtcB (3'-phosphate/5'-hydroxy nucleic acid ligase)